MPDPGNTLVDALPIDLSLPIPTESVGAADADDYYVFTTTGYTDFRLDLTGLSADADVALLDAAGNFVDGSVNGGSQPETISRAGLAPGTYYIWVNAFLGDTPYNLSVSATPSLEPGNTPAAARPIGTVGPGVFSFDYTDSVSLADVNDYFRLTVAQTSDISVTLEGLGPLGDADLEIRNASGGVIRRSALSGPFDLDSATAFGLAPGAYFIRVNHYQSAPGPSPYSLTVLGIPPAPLPPDTGGEAIAPARLVAGGTALGATAVTRNDAVGFRDPFDLWSFSTTVPTNFTLTLSGLTADADVFLFNDPIPASFIPFAEGINLGTASEEITVPNLLPGPYFIAISMANVTESSRYTLQARAVPVNAGAVDGAGSTLAAARIVANLPDGQQSFADSVGGGDASDYYRITTGYTTNLSVSLTGLSADASVQLLNSAGTALASSATPGTASESIIRNNLAAGNYYVRVLPVGTASTPYTLTLNAPLAVPADNAGNTSDTPRDIALSANPASFTDYVGTLDGDDWYRFTTTGTSNLRLSLTGLTADADVAVLDSAGLVALGISVNGGSVAEQISLDALPAGTYTVNVFGFAGDTNYTLTLSAAPPPDGAGSTLATARAVGPLAVAEKTFTDFVGAGDADDYYRFTTAALSNFRLSLTGLTADADVLLLRSTGTGTTDVAQSIPSGPNAEALNVDDLVAGTYYVHVLNPLRGTGTGYTLRMSAGPTDGDDNSRQAPRDIGALGATARTFTDYVGASDAADFYRFTTAGVSNFRLAMTAMTADADVQLQDAGGNVVATSAVGGSGNEAIAFNNLAAGTYFVHVYPYSGSTRYTLSLRAEAPPIPDGAGNTQATARAMGTLGVTPMVFTDFVGAADANDYYRFTTTAPSNFRLRLDGLSADANVQLLTANGAGSVVNGTPEGDGAETIAFSLAAGTHLIRVTPGTGANTPYRLTAAAEPPDDFGGDTLPAATPFIDPPAPGQPSPPLGTTQVRRSDDFVGTGDPHDYFRFTTDRTSNLLVNLTGLTADADVEILNGAGTRLALGSAGGTAPETVRLPVLAAGEYTVHVFPYSGNTRYTLGVTAQVPTDGAGNGTTTARAIALTPADQTLRDFVGAVDGNDYYRFTLAASSTVFVGLEGLTGDANVELRGGTGGATNLGTGAEPGIAAESLVRTLNPGTYWVRVLPSAAGVNADYTLRVRAQTAALADASDDSPASARAITVGGVQQTFPNYVGPLDAADFYRFSLTQASGLRVSLTGAAATADVVLMQANGQLLPADRAPSTPASDQLEFDRLGAGTYYLRVFSPANADSFFTLGVRTVAADDLPATTATTGQVIPGGSAFTGRIENVADVDWIRVTLAANTTYTIRQLGGAAPGLADPAIRGIFDGGGTLQPGTTNDDFGGARDSQVTFRPAATGIYYIAAGGAGGTTGSYRVSVSSANLAPLAGTPLPAQNATEGQPFSLRLPWQLFTDPEGGTLTLSAALSDGRALPAWLTFDAGSESFSGTPLASSPDLTIRITARDPELASASSTFLLRTPAGGDDFGTSAGTAGTAAPGTGARGSIETAYDLDWFKISLGATQSVTIDLRGADTGGGTLADPFLAGIFDGTGQLIGGTSDDDSGTGLDARLSFTAPSSGDFFIAAASYASGTGSYTVSVTGLTDIGAPSNAPPVVAGSGIPDQQAREGVAFSYQVPLATFTDPESQALAFTASQGNGAALPAWLAFNAATRTFTGTPPASGPDLTLRVTARDPGGLTASDEFLLATPAPGSATGPVTPARDTWTLMVYLAADNNLEEFALKDLNEMEAVNLPSSVNVVVLVDRAPGFSTGSGNWTDTRRGQIVRDSNTSLVSSPLTSLGELNTGDPRTLTNFIDWASSNFQADRYGLVVWDHGGGLSGVAWDDSSAGANLSIAETSRAIAASNLGRLDFVGFDTCLQGMAEQAVDLRTLADVVVASQDLEPGDGWDYAGWLNPLAANPSLDEFQVASAAVTAYGNFYQDRQTLAAVRTDLLGDLTTAINDFVAAAVSDGSPMTLADRQGIVAARNQARSFSNQSNRDLGGFMTAVSVNTNIATDISGAASGVVAALNIAVGDDKTGAPNASGLSIFLPNTASAAGMSEYNPTNYRFLAETQWRSFLTALNT